MARIPPSLIEQILDRVPIEVVVGRRVKLVRAGRELKGLSPSGEKTASLFVSPHKRAFFDFSSGINGNAITWLMEVEKMAFMDAIEWLAAEAGIKLPPKQAAARSAAEERVRRDAGDAIAVAQAWFVENLTKNKAALQYLDDRDIEPSTARSWGLGWAPDRWDGLMSHLRAEGFTLDALKATGLIIHGEEIDREHDRFRGRLMIPIRDARGKIVSWGGRLLGPGEPKYLNGPETGFFEKGRTLFGLDRAAEAIRKAGVAILGEGYFDVIRPHQAGLKTVVAPLGTAVQDHHLQILWKLSPLIVSCFDGDAAGRRAARKTMEAALPMIAPDRRIAFAALPAGKDPDDVVAEGGRAALEALTAKAIPLADALWLAAEDGADDQPEGRAKAITEARRLADLIGDADMRKAFIAEIERRARGAGGPARIDTRRRASINPAEAALVLAATIWPAYVNAGDELFGMLEIASPASRRVRDALLDGRLMGEREQRDLAVLRESVPAPAPSFVVGEDAAAWMESLRMRHEAIRRAARRKARAGPGGDQSR